MYNQSEYLMSYALVAAFVVLGMLVVCIPRPRKAKYLTKEQLAKEKIRKANEKTKARAQKDAAKRKKKAKKK
jgi:hypothetical protein